MSTTTYTIEKAKSGRAACKKCKEKIGQGDLRIGVHSEFDDKVMTKWYHLECFPIPRKFNKMSIEEFLDEYIDDETEEKLLSDEKEKETIVEMMKSKKVVVDSKTESGGEGGGVSSYMKNVIQNANILEFEAEAEDGDDGIKPKKKRSKIMSDNERALAEAYLKFKNLKTGELQDILSWNKVVKTGNKNVLLTRVIDGYINGRIGKCVDCTEGKPRIADDGSGIVCNGYYDENLGTRRSCGSKIKIDAAERLFPWFDHEPTEEEKEAMNDNEMDNRDTQDDIPIELRKSVNEIEWNLSSKDNIKKALSAMVEICSTESSPIDLPSDSAKVKMEIGTLIIQNKDQSASTILSLIIKKYGLKEKNAEVAKKRTEKAASNCAVPSNASIYEVLKELSDLYYKEGNTNAGVTYSKVSIAVKQLDFEINEDNAIGLGKGKTKVPGIGKGSADKIYEFLTTGKIEKLEEKRAALS